MIDNFFSTLRINILEMLTYSKVQKNKKRLSFADILNQVKTLYLISKKKPTAEEAKEALDFHLKRSYISQTAIGKVDMYSITERGRDILSRLDEEDDTVVI